MVHNLRGKTKLVVYRTHIWLNSTQFKSWYLKVNDLYKIIVFLQGKVKIKLLYIKCTIYFFLFFLNFILFLNFT